MSSILRSTSPSTRSTTSTASVDTIRSLYGDALAAAFDPAAFDALDADVLFDPHAAFADTCWAAAAPVPAPAPARRSVWVHSGLGASASDSDSDSDSDASPFSPTFSFDAPSDDEDDAPRPPSYATLDKIAPWAGATDVQRRASVLAFRRPSGASTLLELELEPAPRRSGGAAPSFFDFERELSAPAYGSPTLAPLRPVRFVEPVSEPVSPTGGNTRRFGFGLRKRA